VIRNVKQVAQMYFKQKKIYVMLNFLPLVILFLFIHIFTFKDDYILIMLHVGNC